MKLLKANQHQLAYCAKLSASNMAPYYERWGEPVIDEVKWSQVTAGQDTYLIIPEIDVPIGFVSVRVDPNDPTALFLVEIQMEPGHRGEGAFKSIRPYIRQIMREKGLTAITGSVHRDNPLVAFYEKIGYRKVAVTPTRYMIRKDFSAEDLQETDTPDTIESSTKGSS